MKGKKKPKRKKIEEPECRDCGTLDDLFCLPDPYSMVVHKDHTNKWICGQCYRLRAAKLEGPYKSTD